MPVVDGGTLFVAEDDFVGPWRPHEAVVLAHGFCRNGNLWAPWVPHLGHHYRVLRPDLRGCGRSADPGPEYQPTTESYVDDLFRVLDELEVESVHYVGEATGAFIGMAAAARAPERIRSLNLFNTPMGATAETQEVYALGHASWPDALRELGVEGWWRKAGAGGDRPTEDEDVRAANEWFIQQAAGVPVHIAIGMLTLSSDLDVPSVLQGVTAPTRFLTSSRYSFNTSREQLQRLADCVPGAVIHELDVRNRAGLYCFHDVDTVAPDVLAHLRSVDAGR